MSGAGGPGEKTAHEFDSAVFALEKESKGDRDGEFYRIKDQFRKEGTGNP